MFFTIASLIAGWSAISPFRHSRAVHSGSALRVSQTSDPVSGGLVPLCRAG